MTDTIKLNAILGNGINYLLDKNDHQRIITNLSSQIKNYIAENDEMIKDRVKKEAILLSLLLWIIKLLIKLPPDFLIFQRD
jgi:hypothetical protein